MPTERMMLASSRGEGLVNSKLSAITFEQLVGIAGVHTARLDVTGDVCPGQPELTWGGGQIGHPAGSQQVHPQCASSAPALLPS